MITKEGLWVRGSFDKIAYICNAYGNNLVKRGKWVQQREKYKSKGFGKNREDETQGPGGGADLQWDGHIIH